MEILPSRNFIINERSKQFVQLEQPADSPILLSRQLLSIHINTNSRKFVDSDYEDYIHGYANINPTTGIYKNSYIYSNNCKIDLNTIVNNANRVAISGVQYNAIFSKDHIKINEFNNEFRLCVVIRAPWQELVSHVYYATEDIIPDSLMINTTENFITESKHFKMYYHQIDDYYNVPISITNSELIVPRSITTNTSILCISNENYSCKSVYPYKTNIMGSTNNESLDSIFESNTIIWGQKYNATITFKEGTVDDIISILLQMNFKLFVNKIEFDDNSVSIDVFSQSNKWTYTVNIISKEFIDISDIVVGSITLKMFQFKIRYNVYHESTLIAELEYSNAYNQFYINSEPELNIYCQVSGLCFNIKPSDIFGEVIANFSGITTVSNMVEKYPNCKCGIFDIQFMSNNKTSSIIGHTKNIYIEQINSGTTTTYNYKGSFIGIAKYFITDQKYFNNIISGSNGKYGRYPLGIANPYCAAIDTKRCIQQKIFQLTSRTVNVLDTIAISQEYEHVITFDYGDYNLNTIICKLNTSVPCASIREVTERYTLTDIVYIVVEVVYCKVKVKVNKNNKNYLEFSCDSIEAQDTVTTLEYTFTVNGHTVTFSYTPEKFEYSLLLLTVQNSGVIVSSQPLPSFKIDYNNIKSVPVDTTSITNNEIKYFNANFTNSVYFENGLYSQGKIYYYDYYVPQGCSLVIKSMLTQVAADAVYSIVPTCPNYIEFDSKTGKITCKSMDIFMNHKFTVYYTANGGFTRIYTIISINYIKYQYTFQQISLIQDKPFNKILLSTIPELQLHAYIFSSIQISTQTHKLTDYIPGIVPSETSILQVLNLADGFSFNTVTNEIFGIPQNTMNYVISFKTYFNMIINHDNTELYYNGSQCSPMYTTNIYSPVDINLETQLRINVYNKSEYLNGVCYQLYHFNNSDIYNSICELDNGNLCSIRIQSKNNIQKKLMNDLLFNYVDSQSLTKDIYLSKYFKPDVEPELKKQILPSLNATVKSNYNYNLKNIQIEQLDYLNTTLFKPLKSYLFGSVSSTSTNIINRNIYNLNSYVYDKNITINFAKMNVPAYFLCIPIPVYNEINGYIFPFINNSYNSFNVPNNAQNNVIFTYNNSKYISLVNTSSEILSFTKTPLYNKCSVESGTMFVPISIDDDQMKELTTPSQSTTVNNLQTRNWYYTYKPKSILSITESDYYHWVPYFWIQIVGFDNIYDSKTNSWYFAKVNTTTGEVTTQIYSPKNKQWIHSLNNIQVKLLDPDGNLLPAFEDPSLNIQFTLTFSLITDYIEGTERNYNQVY